MSHAAVKEHAGIERGTAAAVSAAFAEVAERRRAQLLWLAGRMTRNQEEAEDVLQEALLKAHKHLAQFRGDSQMGTWITVIVKNTGREWLRRQKRWPHLPLEEIHDRDDGPVAMEFADPAEDPEQHCARTEVAGMLLAEMENLDSVCKSALRMCVLEELSHEEAARSLGVNACTVKSRIFHGKRLLRRAMARRLSCQEGESAC